MNDRREFIKTTGRYSVLVLMGIAGVAGFAFKKINTEAKAACPTSPFCKGCGQLANCQKDQAKEFVNTEK